MIVLTNVPPTPNRMQGVNMSKRLVQVFPTLRRLHSAELVTESIVNAVYTIYQEQGIATLIHYQVHLLDAASSLPLCALREKVIDY